MSTFHEFVDHMPDSRARYVAMLLYLTGARASEVCTHVSKYDEVCQRSKPYGQYLRERITDYQSDKVLLIELATARAATSTPYIRQKHFIIDSSGIITLASLFEKLVIVDW
jgi:hypothetical protein